MAYHTRNLPGLIPTTTGAGSVTQGIGALDDAERIHLYMVSTVTASSTFATGLLLQVSQFDPSAEPQTGVVTSTAWHTISTTLFPIATSSGACHVIEQTGFRGLRLSGLSSATAGQIVAYVTKQIML
jgi:hypothetical protein